MLSGVIAALIFNLGISGQLHFPTHLTLVKKPASTHSVGGCMDPGGSLDSFA